MALADLLPGGKGNDNAGSIEAEAARLTAENPELANPPDPYEGTALSRESLGTEPDPAPEPAPQPAAAEPAPAPAPQEPQQQERAPAIPKARFDEVVAERRHWQQVAQQNQQQLAQLFQMLQQPQPGQQAPPAPPSVEDDPVGAVRYLQENVGQLAQALQQQREAEQQRIAQMQVQQRAAAMEHEFRQATPDYGDALEHLMSQRRQQLEVYGQTMLGLSGADLTAQVNAQLGWEANNLISSAVRAGRNPAEVAYAAARASGYTPKAAAAVAAAATQATPMPTAPAAAAAAPPPPASKAAAATTLPPGGRPERARLSVEQAVNGTDEEFDAMFAEMARNSRGRRRTPMWDRGGRRA